MAGLKAYSLLAASKTDLAVVRGDLEMPTDAESVAILRKNVVVLWAPLGSSRQRLKETSCSKDQKPRRSARTPSGDHWENLSQRDAIPRHSHRIRNCPWEGRSRSIRQKSDRRDGARSDDCCVHGGWSSETSKITTDAIAATAHDRGEPKFLPIDVSETIAQKHPLYESEEIPGSTFSSSPARPSDKIETVSINHLIVARRSLSETTVGEFTRQLFAVRPGLAKEMPSAARIETPDTDKDAALPAHRGAAAYIDGTERTFLREIQRLYVGAILLLSGLGSAGAWFRSYVKTGEKAPKHGTARSIIRSNRSSAPREF